MKPAFFKRYISRIFQFLFFLAPTFFLLTGCAASSSENSPKSFDSFLQDCFKEYVSSDAVTLHFKLSNPSAFGLSYSAAPSYGDFSCDSQREDCQRAAELLSTLLQYDFDALSEDDQLTWQIFKETLETSAASEDYILYQSLLGTNGLQSQIPVTLSEYYFNNEEDIKTYLALLNQVPELFEQLLDFEDQRRSAGMISPDFVIENTIEQIEQFLSGSENENLLIKTFEEKVNNVPHLGKDQKNTYINNNSVLVRQVVLPAFENLKTDLEKYSGASSEKERLCQYENGQEYYSLLLSANVGTDMSPEECITVLENQLQNAIKDITSLTEKNPELYTDYLSAQPALSDEKEILNKLESDILIDFPEPPEVSYTLKNVPDALASTSASAFYLLPPIDAFNENVIYINQNRVDSSDQFSTLAHEGYPGHLYQNNYYISTNPTPIRHLLRCDGYDEGWGTYAQLYSYDYLDFQDASPETTALLRQLYKDNDILSLSLSSLSDLYVNYENYDSEELSEYLEDYGVPSENARSIYEYVIENPTSYLSYSVGWYELENLRNTMEKELGNDFDIKEFHKAVLDSGSCSFSILRSQVKKVMSE